MSNSSGSLVVSDSACGTCSIKTVKIHHRDYPETVCEGVTVSTAAEHLANQLVRSLEHAPDHDRRAGISRALEEVRAFLKHDGARGAAVDAPGAIGPDASVPGSPRALPGEVIDVCPIGAAPGLAKTAALIKTAAFDVYQRVLPRGQELPPHSVRGEAIIFCLDGDVVFSVDGSRRELKSGQLLYLKSGQAHSAVAVDDTSLLVTVVHGLEAMHAMHA